MRAVSLLESEVVRAWLTSRCSGRRAAERQVVNHGVELNSPTTQSRKGCQGGHKSGTASKLSPRFGMLQCRTGFTIKDFSDAWDRACKAVGLEGRIFMTSDAPRLGTWFELAFPNG